MDKPIIVYKNMIWEILDQGSKLAILTLIMEQGFEGNCKVIAEVNNETTVLKLTDEFDHEMVLPINILDILNL